MNPRRCFRTAVLILSTALVMLGLASCKLPASEGPETTETSDGFPVPGNTATSGINISVFATQTAQARPPVIVPTSGSNEYPAPTIEIPVATDTPEAPSATATPITYISATPGGPPATYTLAEGEFPYCIARRFDVNLDEMLTLNNLTLDSLLSPGQVLKIPQTGNPFIGNRVLHEHPTTYQIQSGDTLYKIACYFGDVSPDMI
ncbi:MAG TPA: LysM peptidoglycan-binding domain-containing protein, partial [Anaerolineales bacterium]|nr:LysM peptidoglycan-binding domain-containing protein [Anaerolineales bacterium]